MLADFQRQITTPHTCTERLIARLVLNHDLGIGQTAANAIGNRFFNDDLGVPLMMDAGSFDSLAGGG